MKKHTGTIRREGAYLVKAAESRPKTVLGKSGAVARFAGSNENRLRDLSKAKSK